MNILLIFVTSTFLNFYPLENIEIKTKVDAETAVKRDGEKRYKKKKHWLKKLIMGKRYCDCPKYN